ncbi:DotA/TraY family protein [Acidithiobacillus sp. IBUN Pt1247-S3]|uniref:DotA/TraY family protein n=1 Tax=Acidithiobacillus sp. IBUN Pt1247-S3 TaxID=3166642 RepID=UPI0034E61A89
MSFDISLIPQSNDISVHLLSQLLGNGWWTFVSGSTAPSGPGSIIAQLFQIIDIALLMYVSAVIVYTQIIGGMQTAHEGVPLGKRYHSIWSVIRGPAAWFLLFPLPWAKGFAMIQVILLTATYWGIGVADDVWSAFVQDVPKYAGTLIPYQGETQKKIAFMEQALITATAWDYLIEHSHGAYKLGTYWTGGNSSGEQVWGMVPSGNQTAGGIQGQFGTIAVHCSSGMTAPGSPNFPNLGIGSLLSQVADPIFNTIGNATGQLSTGSATPDSAQNNPVCVQQINAISNALFPLAGSSASLSGIASKINQANASSNGAMPSTSDLNAVIGNYLTDEKEIYDEINSNYTAQQKSALTAFANEASSLGWASSSFYWWTLENINAQSQAQMTGVDATVILPNAGAMSGQVGAYYKPYLAAIEGYILQYNHDLNAQKDTLKNATAAAVIGNSGSSGETWAGKMLAQVPPLFASGDPLANVAAFGRMIKQAGEDVAFADAAVKTVSGAVSGGTGGILGGKGGGALSTSKIIAPIMGLGGGAMGALKAVGSFAVPAAVMMIIEGAILQYVFPAMPGIIMITAIIGWLFLVLEMVVASVLWAAAHVYAEGEGFAPQQAQYGYSVVIGILMRPLLLTVGFIFAFFVMDIGGWFVGMALQVFLAGMGSYHIGIIGLISMIGVIIAMMFLFIKTVMKLITHLADHAPQWIGGHSGQSLGMDEAQNTASRAGSGVKEYGMYAGNRMADTYKGAVEGSGAVKGGKSAKAEDEKKEGGEKTVSTETINSGRATDTGNGGGKKKESTDE